MPFFRAMPAFLAAALAAAALAQSGEFGQPADAGNFPTAAGVAPAPRIQSPYPDIATDERWTALAPWQRDFVFAAVKDNDWHRARGYSDQKWASLPAAAKSRIILNALEQETDRRFERKLVGLQAKRKEMNARRSHGKPLTVAERQAFAREVLNLDRRHPDAADRTGKRQMLQSLQEAAVRFDLEAEYALTHPSDARYQQAVQAARDAEAAAKAPGLAAAKSGLDRFFDRGRAGLEIPKARDDGPGAALPPDAGRPRPGLRDAAVPPQPRIRFEGSPPAEPVRLAAWRKAGGPEIEQRYYDKVMAGLTTKTERAVLERLARNQQAWESGGKARREAMEEAEKLLILEMRRPLFDKLSREEQESTKKLLAEIQDGLRQNLVASMHSAEVLVSFVDLDEYTAGQAYWDSKPAADGKIHIRMELSRDLVLTADWKERPTQVRAMKLFTHEFSHSADMADPAGMLRGLTERVANLNEAVAYKEEGLPTGEGTWAIMDQYLQLRRDPIAWTARHLTHKAYIEDGDLWSYKTIDDVRDPEAGLRWRLHLAYHYATRLQEDAFTKGLQGPLSMTDTLKRLQLGPEIGEALAAVYLDRSLRASDKPRVFAERAAKTTQARHWVAQVRATEPGETGRLAAAHEDYWKGLSELMLTP